jgi:hypothetical protein
MDWWYESIKVSILFHQTYTSVDTLPKMKDALPSLEKYTDQSCPEEIFSEIYHWIFTYLKENEMKKVVDLDVPPPVDLIDV